MRPSTAISLLALTVAANLGACAGGSGDATSTTTSASTTTTEGAPAQDAALRTLLLEVADLPEGFDAAPFVDDTITAFCAGEDATAGLRATAREVRGFTRAGGGASVIQLAFRFRDDGAETFVAQAGEILERCSGVPDATGLAFDYDALDPAVAAPIAAASDHHAGRHGVNVGSATLSIDVVVLQRGDIGQLVAVLGVDLPRAELDALATAAFTAVAAKL